MRLLGYAYSAADPTGIVIARQRLAIEEWAEENGHDLIGIVSEVGQRDKPGLELVVGSLARDDVDGLVVWHVDRLWRLSVDLYLLLKRLAGIDAVIMTVGDEVYRSDDANDRLISDMEALLRERESTDRSQRIKRGMAEAKERRRQLEAGD